MLLDSSKGNLGWQAASFTLPDANEQEFSLVDCQGAKGLVVAFICNHCPYVKAVAQDLAADARTLKSEGINLVAINSNDFARYTEDSPAKMLQFAQQYEFEFPYLVDEDQTVAKAYDAVCTPDFFGFDAAGVLKYRGRLNSAGMQTVSNKVPELVNAMRHIAATGEPPADQLPSMGCSIKWKSA